MPRVTPEEGAQKLIDRAKAAAPHIAAQVAKVTVAPTASAIAAIPKMQTNFNSAVASGKVERGLRRVTLGDWKDAMINKGVPRISQGLDQAQGKIVAFNREFYPHLERVQSEIAAMPSTTLEDNIQRMIHNVRRNADFVRS